MERGKTAAVLAVFVAFAGAAAGHNGHSHAAPPTSPGVIGAGSPLYPVDVVADRAMVAVNLATPGDVAFERASEISHAASRNNSQARERAQQQLNEIAAVASSNDTTGLEKAAAVLEAVKSRTPDQADAGLDTALANVQAAQNRKPSQVPSQIPEHPAMGNANPPT